MEISTLIVNKNLLTSILSKEKKKYKSLEKWARPFDCYGLEYAAWGRTGD